VTKFAGVRFASVLAASERERVDRSVRSRGAAVTSWNDAGERTFALVALGASADIETLRAVLPDADVAMPPRAVLRVSAAQARRNAALAAALAGAGRPAGVVASATEADAVVIEVDMRRTPLALVVTLVDVVADGCARRIEPVLPLGDEELTALAGAILGEPNLAPSRLIETYLDPIRSGGTT
jgi:hypothetical protein